MNTNPISTNGIKEPVRHGTKDFPLQFYKDVTYQKSGLVLYNHWHEEAEILSVTEGELELVINNLSIFARKGTILLIPPNLLHAAYQSHDQKGCFSALVFHSDFVSSKNNDKIQKEFLLPFLNSNFVSSYVIDLMDSNSGIVRYLFQEICETYVRKPAYGELMIKGYLYQILFYLLQNETLYDVRSSSVSLTEARKKAIISFIENNYQNPVTLSEMASSINLSREQFCRFFKQSFRDTPMNYLNQYRMNRSMELLAKTNLSIIDIAISIGFDSSNYFSIVFKKVTGMTPSQFRKTMK